ncbi:Mobile element protein (plasmid) [Sinorhizobium alkalisoli]|nr:Mobile element protein [Sinorhizobium alkalisoli]
MFDRLRDECGFTGGYTIIKDYIREREQRRQEVFVPSTSNAPYGRMNLSMRCLRNLGD